MQNPVIHYFFRLLIIPLFLITSSCGKKEPPQLPSYEKPERPSNLHAIHRGEEILLTWSYKGDKNLLEGFEVIKAEKEGFVKIAFVEKGNLYSDKKFTEGDIYKYKVAGRSMNRVMGDFSEEITVNPLPAPPPPIEISFKIEKDSVNISWTHPENSIFFNIYRSKEKGRYTLMPLNKTPLKASAFSDTLNTEAIVYYTVRALTDSLIRDESPASNEIAITPDDYIPLAPEGLQAIALEKGVQLVWKENPETWVREYMVYRGEHREGSTQGFELIGKTDTPAFLDKEGSQTPDKKQISGRLFYRIIAIGPTKEGPYSNPIEIENLLKYPSE